MVRPELRRNPLVFVQDLAAPELEPQDRVHLERSLRLRSGDRIVIADGQGRWQLAVLGQIIETIGDPEFEDPTESVLTVGFSLVKGERSDLVVQKLTELGIDRIAPVITERCVVRWDKAKIDKNLNRHRRIVKEAAMQSRNLWLPVVEPAQPFEQFEASFTQNNPGALLALAEPGAPPLPPAAAAIVVGPEGGFSPAELQGRSMAGLPGRVLRSETAAITAAVLLAARR